MRTEELIFSQLLNNEQYARAVIPHIDVNYFSSNEDKNFFKIYHRYFTKHSAIPSKQAMAVEIEKLKSNADTYNDLKALLNSTQEFNESQQYLLDTTEAFCRERAIYNALKESVLIVDGQTKDKEAGAIPSILQKALSVCFNTSIGHDYYAEAQQRFDYYHMSQARVPTGIPIFDEITKGGFPRKSLNVLLAPPHGGKSLVMCNFGVGALLAGYNVLYITMEMAEYEIGKRFDVNMMGVDFETLELLPKATFESKFQKISSASRGKLIIKEFPTGAAHAGHFRAMLDDLKTKQDFKPDLIIVDYMGICASEKYKAGGGANSYTIGKSVGEELRAMAIQYDAAVVTAVQTTRAGVGNSDVDITATSESFGVPAIADWFAAIINTDELKNMNQIMFKQLKNRYKNLDDPSRFFVGVDTSMMKIFDLGKDAVKLNTQSKGQSPKAEAQTVDFGHQIKPTTASFDNFNF